MTPQPRIRRSFKNPWDEIDYLYQQVLYWFYEKENRSRCYPYAFRLQRLLAQTDPRTESLLGMDARAVLAELARDWREAIQYRTKAINSLLRLQRNDRLRQVHLTPDDLRDRMDLLAIHYWDAGQPRRALKTLAEAEAFCQASGIPFDGANIRDEITAELAATSRSAAL